MGDETTEMMALMTPNDVPDDVLMNTSAPRPDSSSLIICPDALVLEVDELSISFVRGFVKLSLAGYESGARSQMDVVGKDEGKRFERIRVPRG
jgi:hypothetical protein